jgi:hypothetical protein
MTIIIVIFVVIFIFFSYLLYDFYNTVLMNGHINDTISQKTSLFGTYLYNLFMETPGQSTNTQDNSKDASGNNVPTWITSILSTFGQNTKTTNPTDVSGNTKSSNTTSTSKDASGNPLPNKDASGNPLPNNDASGNKVSSPPYPNTNTTSIKQPGTSIGDQTANQNPNNALASSLQYSADQYQQQYNQKQQLYNLPQAQDYCADDSCSTIQQAKPLNKAGWCYVGTDRGFRSCVEVGEADKCMSGQIFPSQNICVNPSLR